MEINLIPRKSFVEKYYFYFSMIIVLILAAQAYLLFTFYLDKQKEYLDLQYDIQRLQTDLSTLEENRQWNMDVAQHNTQVKELRSYQALVDGLQLLEYDWSVEMQYLRNILPQGSDSLLNYTISSNQFTGKVYLSTLSEVAQWIDQLHRFERFSDIMIESITQDLQSVDRFEVNFRFLVHPSFE